MQRVAVIIPMKESNAKKVVQNLLEHVDVQIKGNI